METANFFLLGALISAGVAGFFWLKTPAAHIGAFVHSFVRLPSAERRLVIFRKLAIQGVRVLHPFAARLLLIAPVHSFVLECMSIFPQKAHMQIRAQALVSSVLAVLIVLSALLGLLLGSVLSGIAVVVALSVLVACKMRSERDKQVNNLRLCVPDSIQGMKSCFQAGLSLEQTLEYLSCHTSSDMQRLYNRALQSLRLGSTVTTSLNILREEINAPEFAFVIAALDIQHKTGGSLSSVLQDAEEAARGQFELERSLRTHTAQARLSARVVSAMPFVLMGIFSLTTQGFLEPFFTSFAGFMLFVFALAMQGAGIVLVRKTLQVKGVSL